MLAACAPHARWVDAFCEDGAFSVDECRLVLRAGLAAGLGARLHANQLGPGPGVRLAVEIGAASADHCTHLTPADVDDLAAGSTVATLLPLVEFSTRSPYPDARALLDAGATETGRPYFVMELVRGIPITEYCDGERLSIRQRLELFVPVCQAVQHAHQKGLIHRDIKPGNILVTSSGTPKLLDFGVAKILNPDILSGSPDSIGTVAPAMTPDYASPEQISGGLVTEASDVYSLGVLLFELLTGERPKSRLDDIRVREGTPPSRTEGGRGLHRDLDDIVLMAMQPEPEKRYPSAAAFEADIHRYLDSRPVLARKGSLRYRAARLISRNKATAVLTGVVLVLAVAGAKIWQVRDRSAGSAQPEIVSVTSMPGAESQPNFSPDGKSIVYVWDGENGTNSDLYVQSLVDGSVRRLTSDPADDLSPVWSPDGSRIAWLRMGPSETAVFVAALAGGAHAKVADVYPIRVEAVGRHLDWSPDGEYLAVPDKSQAEEPFHIVRIRAKDGLLP
jgi:serine/threonine protein kinase